MTENCSVARRIAILAVRSGRSAPVLPVALLATMGLLAGCTLFDPMATALRMAEKSGLNREVMEAGGMPMVLHVRQAGIRGSHPLVVYIEGDSIGAYSRTGSSGSSAARPTPLRPLALFMAASDPSPNVLHIGRPCQFLPDDRQRRCDPRLWTSHRYGEEVVAAMNEAITRVVMRQPTGGLRLVGHSGGGALAVLVAGRRFDVLDLRTMAGILDTSGINAANSLNPRDAASRIASLPQIHWTGGRDPVAGRAMLDAYVHGAGITPCIALRELATASHDEGWAENWPRLSAERPRCW